MPQTKNVPLVPPKYHTDSVSYTEDIKKGGLTTAILPRREVNPILKQQSTDCNLFIGQW